IVEDRGEDGRLQDDVETLISEFERGGITAHEGDRDWQTGPGQFEAVLQQVVSDELLGPEPEANPFEEVCAGPAADLKHATASYGRHARAPETLDDDPFPLLP